MKPTERGQLACVLVSMALLGGCSQKNSLSDFPELPRQPVSEAGTNRYSLPDLPPPPQVNQVTQPAQAGTAAAAPPSPPISAPTSPTIAADGFKSKPMKFARANSVAADYSRYALGKGQYWESIVAQVEGFRGDRFYRDNIGVAIGFGYNASHQSKLTNQRAGLEVLKSELAAQTLVSLTGNMSPSTLPAFPITPEQGMGMSVLLKPSYEDPMRSWILGYERLKPHQQAVLVYHAYKTGAGGAKTYNTLKAKIAAMLVNPTEETTRAAGAQFQYTYKVGGKTKTDTRSTVYMQALWNDPEAYAALIGGKSSTFVATLPEFKGSGKSSVSEDDIDDPIGEVKSEMERTGKRIPLTLEAARPNRPFIPNF